MKEKPHILFVDDDELIRKIYTDRFQASGITVDAVSSGLDAKAALEAKTYDLICLDYMLADLTGLEILKWIRQVKKIGTPTIIFSASGQEAKMNEFLAAGATEYIQKDHVVPSELVQKIIKLTEKHD